MADAGTAAPPAPTPASGLDLGTDPPIGALLTIGDLLVPDGVLRRTHFTDAAFASVPSAAETSDLQNHVLHWLGNPAGAARDIGTIFENKTVGEQRSIMLK